MRVFTRISLALTLLFLSNSLMAQNHYAAIRSFNQAYTSLVGAETIPFDESTSLYNFTFPDHEFRFFGAFYQVDVNTTVEIGVAGTFKFNNGTQKITLYGNTTSMKLRDASSKVLFLEEGDYYKFEFVNIGYKSPDASADDYTNYQVWFNKTNDDIEFHYSTSNFVDIMKAHGGATGPLIGLTEFEGSSFSNIALLQGPPNLCQAQNNFGTLNGVPAEGSVYVLRNLKLSVAKVNSISARVYPNPVATQLTIDLADINQANVEVYDILGNKVLDGEIIMGDNMLDVSALKSGQYIIRITNDESVSNIRFNKI